MAFDRDITRHESVFEGDDIQQIVGIPGCDAATPIDIHLSELERNFGAATVLPVLRDSRNVCLGRDNRVIPRAEDVFDILKYRLIQVHHQFERNICYNITQCLMFYLLSFSEM